MRFLLNMNLPRELGRLLRTRGHDFRHAGDCGCAEATDVAIVEVAQKEGETVITHDLDYGRILAFSGERSPSVIIFRISGADANELFQRLMEAWPTAEGPLAEGAIVVVEEAAVRIRRLPIRRGRGTP